jgi:CRISPR-associated protein Cas1
VGSALAVSTEWRLLQYQCHQNPQCRLYIATQLMQLKLEAQNKTLAYLQEEPIDFAFNARNLQQLLGYEGQIAHIYYQKISQNIDPQWNFTGRNRRPPKDPYNSLLSLGYTLLVSEMNNAVNAAALDPWLGFYHETYPARPALALDFIEPLRPQIDLWSLMLLDQFYNPEDFTYSEQDGCRLNKEARKIYYQQWAEIRQQWQDGFPTKTLAQTCRELVQQLKSWLKDPRWQPPIDNFSEHAPF